MRRLQRTSKGALLFAAGVLVSAALAAMAVAQSTDSPAVNPDDAPSYEGIPYEGVYEGVPPLEECPSEQVPGEIMVDSILPKEGETQSPETALNRYLSYHSVQAKDAAQFEFAKSSDGAISAAYVVGGEAKALVQFAEIAPGYWVVGKFLQCMPVAPDGAVGGGG